MRFSRINRNNETDLIAFTAAINLLATVPAVTALEVDLQIHHRKLQNDSKK